MFTVYYTNHGYSAQDTFSTVEQAVEYGKSKGFEFSVWSADKNLMASWTVFGGLRRH